MASAAAANPSSGAAATPARLTLDNVAKHDEMVSWKLFQFRCPDCLIVFWRRTDPYRPYAGCRTCKKKWKRQGKIPRRLKRLADNEMIGYADFECECGNKFKNSRAMYEETQPCVRKQCLARNVQLYPSSDLRPPPPPRPWDGETRRRRRHIHECSACPRGGCLIENMAVSQIHDSAASETPTVPTIATQYLQGQQGDLGDPTRDWDVYEVFLKSNLPPYVDPSEPFRFTSYLTLESGPHVVNSPPTIPE